MPSASPAGPVVTGPDPAPAISYLPHDGSSSFVAAAEAYLHLYSAVGSLPLGTTDEGSSPAVVLLGDVNSRRGLWSRLLLDANAFQLLHIASGDCLRATGRAVGLAACDGSAQQAFSLRAAEAEDGQTKVAAAGRVTQVVAASGLCLLAGSVARAPATLGACTAAAAGWTVLPWVAGGPTDGGWTGIIGTGQSLSIGVAGAPPLSATAARGLNIKLFDPKGAYAVDEAAHASWTVAPLAEPIRPFPGNGVDDVYPANIHGETPHTAMGAQLDALAEAAGTGGWVTAHSIVGRGAQPLSVIEKNGTGNNFAAAISETQAFAALAAQASKPYAVGALVLTHGEADVLNPNYAVGVKQLTADLQAAVVAITGQARAPIMLASQQNSFPWYNAVPLSSLAIVQAANDNPRDIFVTGPKYQYPYAEGVHLVAGGYRRLGHKTAEVFWRISQKKEAWRPLQPTGIELTTPTRLTLSFSIPDPPLVLDDAQPAVHQAANTAWSRGRGFEVQDSSGAPIAIDKVSISAGGDQVVIDLAAPAARPLQVAYAITQDGDNGGGGGYHAGTGLGRSGALRDSDAFVAIDREQIACSLQAGSAAISCAAGLSNRIPTDLVEEAGAAILAISGPTTATLSQPWAGASGGQPLTFRANHYNYLVAFVWPLP